MKSVAEGSSEVEDLIKREESILASRDDFSDNRGVKNKLHKFIRSGGPN